MDLSELLGEGIKIKIPCAITIAGSDSGGGAGIQADLKTFSALGVHGLVVITSVTAQNTRGVQGINNIPPEFVRKQLNSVVQDFEVGWVKTGMLSNSEIINEVSEGVKENGLYLVIDPVMVSASGDSLFEKDAMNGLKSLLKHAKLVTPNIPEAESLSGLEIKNITDCKKAARKISKLGSSAVLIKGGHLKNGEIHNILYSNGELKDFNISRIGSGDFHGTGCTFSAAITSELAKGRELEKSVTIANEFVVDAVKGRLGLGCGNEIVNPLARIWNVTSGSEDILEVQEAVHLLARIDEFAELIPEVGVNIVSAREKAEESSDVIGLSGRIIKVDNKPHITGVPTPGGSEHMANLVLTAMKYNPQIRSAMNIRYSPRILNILKNTGLKVVEFDREDEPRDAKTMEWGTVHAIEKAGEVPDVIFDEGGIGKEAMIRILGRTPSEVVNKVRRVLEKLKFVKDKAAERE